MRVALRRFSPLLLLMFLLGVACRSSPQTTYRLFTTDEGRFQAEFPSSPKRQAVSVTAQGTTLNLIAFTSETPTEAVSVSFVDYPTEIAEENRGAVLNGAAAGAASTLSGTLESNQPTTFLGYEALDFVVDSDSGKATARAFLVGNRMYLFQVVQTDAGEDSADYERLLSTAKIFPGPTPTLSPEPAAGASPAGASSPSPQAPSEASPAPEGSLVSPSLEFPYPQQP